MLNNLSIFKNWQESYNKVSHTVLFKKQFTLMLDRVKSSTTSRSSKHFKGVVNFSDRADNLNWENNSDWGDNLDRKDNSIMDKVL